MRLEKLFVILLGLSFFQMEAIAQVSSIPKELNVCQEFNYIQFHSGENIHKLKKALDNTKKERFTIVHFGDSHIQSERPSSQVRNYLQAEYGSGGFGMMFPYSAAKTYSSIRYSSSYKGSWIFAKSFQYTPKVPIGLSGMSLETIDSIASITFKLKRKDTISNILRLFVDKTAESYDFEVLCADTLIKVYLKDYLSDSLTYIEIQIPAGNDRYQLNVIKSSKNQKYFRFYGMSPQAYDNKGIIYHSVGVGAAPYRSVFNQEKMPEQLSDVDANLVILDFGTNDYLYKDKIDEKLESQIIQIINIVKAAEPNTVILLTTAQDLYYKGRHIKSGDDFRDLIIKIAKNMDCLFWDWYSVSGGTKSLKHWRNEGFCQKDLIHLTVKGYKLKGDLLYDALVNSIDSLDKTDALDSLIFQDLDSSYIYLNTPNSSPRVTQNGSYTYHLIKSGESLGGIAIKYGMTVSELQRLNGLSGTKIIAGKRLKIINRKNSSANTSTSSKKPINNSSSRHNVKRGESLSEIAVIYKTTVQNIMKFNKLKSDKIYAGQVLRIK